MTGYEFCGDFWWIIPVVMIICCFFFMRSCCAKMMCGFGDRYGSAVSAMEILNKRFARGEIDLQEYEEKKRKLAETREGKNEA